MIDRRIVKFKLRRGTETQRVNVVFEEGELVYTVDTGLVYVGDGFTPGGKLVGAQTVITDDGFPADREAGQLIYNSLIKKLFVATTNNPNVDPEYVGPYTDDASITFNTDNKLSLAENGILPKHFNTNSFNPSSCITSTVNGIELKFDAEKFAINSSNELTTDLGLEASTVGNFVSNGLKYDDVTNKIVLDLDNRIFTLTGDNGKTLTLQNSSISAQFVSHILGRGLTLNNGKIELNLQAGSIVFTTEGKIAATGIDDTGTIQSTVPAGTVIYTAGKNAPLGYFIADGSWCQKEDFTELFAALSADVIENNFGGMYDIPIAPADASNGVAYYQRDEINAITQEILTFNMGASALTAANTIRTTSLFRLPDLRGVFLRGVGNNGIYDANGTATEEQVGKFSSDTLKSHFHGISAYGGGIADRNGTGTASHLRPDSTTSTRTENFGDSETAPKHVSLLPCIKY